MWSIQFQKIEDKIGLQRLKSFEESQNGLLMKTIEIVDNVNISELTQKEEKTKKSIKKDDIGSNNGSSASLSGGFVFVDHQDASEESHYSSGSFVSSFA